MLFYSPLTIKLNFSWLCVRTQCQEKSSNDSSAIVSMPNAETQLSWCNGADEWDENDNDAANGNFMNVDNVPSPNNAIQRYVSWITFLHDR